MANVISRFNNGNREATVSEVNGEYLVEYLINGKCTQKVYFNVQARAEDVAEDFVLEGGGDNLLLG